MGTRCDSRIQRSPRAEAMRKPWQSRHPFSGISLTRGSVVRLDAQIAIWLFHSCMPTQLAAGADKPSKHCCGNAVWGCCRRTWCGSWGSASAPLFWRPPSASTLTTSGAARPLHRRLLLCCIRDCAADMGVMQLSRVATCRLRAAQRQLNTCETVAPPLRLPSITLHHGIVLLCRISLLLEVHSWHSWFQSSRNLDQHRLRE